MGRGFRRPGARARFYGALVLFFPSVLPTTTLNGLRSCPTLRSFERGSWGVPIKFVLNPSRLLVQRQVKARVESAPSVSSQLAQPSITEVSKILTGRGFGFRVSSVFSVWRAGLEIVANMSYCPTPLPSWDGSPRFAILTCDSWAPRSVARASSQEFVCTGH